LSTIMDGLERVDRHGKGLSRLPHATKGLAALPVLKEVEV
ncbi:MAG: hypothetical protein QOH03_5513, partial [Kribbellaceae bacterium]|nr:hypothetical protein [Kribbellaceae bacterium]